MKELKCSLPNDRFRLVESNSPGQLFLSDETIDLKLAFKKGDLNGKRSLLAGDSGGWHPDPGESRRGYEGVDGYQRQGAAL